MQLTLDWAHTLIYILSTPKNTPRRSRLSAAVRTSLTMRAAAFLWLGEN
jgi:hypothetical protein